jgi:hypothetical protein
LVLTKICLLQPDSTGALLTKATQTVQTISASALSMAAVSSKTSKWPPNITELQPSVAIAEQNSIAPAACAWSADGSRPIALQSPFPIPLRPIA